MKRSQQLILMLLLSSFPVAVLGASATPRFPVVYFSVNGHYYQPFGFINCDTPPYPSWDLAEAFAESMTVNGIPGHLATPVTFAEQDFFRAHNDLRNGGLLGALRVNGQLQWVVGPDAGKPVDLHGHPFYESCSDWGALEDNNTYYGGVKRAVLSPASYCDLIPCFVPGFVVEFEPGAVPVEPTTWGALKSTYR